MGLGLGLEEQIQYAYKEPLLFFFPTLELTSPLMPWLPHFLLNFPDPSTTFQTLGQKCHWVLLSSLLIILSDG